MIEWQISTVGRDDSGGRGRGSRGRRSRRAFTLVYSCVSMTALVGFAALCVDVGRCRAVKGELQAAADAAALNAANGLSDGTFAAKASAVAASNQADGTAITAASVTTTPGNWTGTTFTANGMPRNAVRVLIERSAAKGNKITNGLSQSLGWAMPDVKATTTVALVNQSDYEWTGLNSVNMTTSATASIYSADATNTGAAQGKTILRSDGSVAVSGTGTAKADVKYGTSVNIGGGVNLTGTTTNITTPTVYPTSSQVANIAGVNPVYTSSTPLTVNTTQSIPGGVYSVTDATIQNCTLTCLGPVTIVVSGNFTMNTAGLRAHGNLPTNLKIISTGTGTISVTNPTSTLYADVYAPNSPFNFSASSGSYGMYGRGLFKTINSNGSHANFVYDRSMTTTSLARKAVVVR